MEFTNQFDKNLLNAYMKFKRKRDEDKQDYLVIIDALLELKPAVDDFFNNVRVLDDDVELRRDRITLLWAIMTPHPPALSSESISFHYSTCLSSIFPKSFHYLLPYFHYFFTIFFCIFQILSLFNLDFLHIFHIFSLFNLPFFHIFPIFSLFNFLFLEK
jgi:hypothetical protein